jgi:hypothetical protein
MSLNRRAAKRDDSERAIIERLQLLGAEVHQLAKPVDLLIGWRGLTRIAEVKTGKGRLTEDQRAFLRTWSGNPVPILTTPDEAGRWLLSLSDAADREARIENRTLHTLKTLEEM